MMGGKIMIILRRDANLLMPSEELQTTFIAS
jgi:hypothetical protein